MYNGPHRGRKAFLPAFAWVTYDFANTIFAIFVGSFAMPVYLNRLTGRDIYMGMSNMLSQLMAAAIGPSAGAVADKTGRNALYMKVATGICIAATAFLAGSSSVWWLVGMFVLANMAYNVAIPFYNALLGRVSSPGRSVEDGDVIIIKPGYALRTSDPYILWRFGLRPRTCLTIAR